MSATGAAENLEDAQFYWDGGGSSNVPDPGFTTTLYGGSDQYGLVPGASASTDIRYRNVATTRDQIKLVGLTLRDYNDPREFKFFNTSFNISYQAQTEETVDVTNFFHPFQSFSSWQKQTVVLSPLSSINLDPGDFDNTKGEISFMLVKPIYSPESSLDERVCFWNYKGTQRFLIGSILVLSGAIKDGYKWKGWSVSPFPDELQEGDPDPSLGGFIFSNPTNKSVKLIILTAT
jgi:hypothetical protein